MATFGLPGCVASSTKRLLDRSYDSASDRLTERTAAVASERGTPDADDAPTSGSLLDERAVVAVAVEKSPSLAALAHRARAMVHAGRAEGALPSAELGFEVWNLPLERPYSLGEADMYMVELRQRFPAAGSLDARARAQAEEARALLFELADEERAVTEAAATAYASFVQAASEHRLQEAQLRLLNRMSEVVQARFSTGSSSLTEAARLRVEVSRTRRAIARSAGELAQARATLVALLHLPDAVTLPEPREVPVETVRLPLDDLLARAEQNRGAVLSADARLRAAEARKAAAVAEARVPEFMAGLGYWQDPSMRPGFGLTSSMSLPWLWGPGKQRVLELDEERAAVLATREGLWLETRRDVMEKHAALQTLESEVSVLSQQTLPALRQAKLAVEATFATGAASLTEWVDLSRSVLDVEIELTILRGELARGVASLERAVGTPLPRFPLAPEETP